MRSFIVIVFAFANKYRRSSCTYTQTMFSIHVDVVRTLGLFVFFFFFSFLVFETLCNLHNFFYAATRIFGYFVVELSLLCRSTNFKIVFICHCACAAAWHNGTTKIRTIFLGLILADYSRCPKLICLILFDFFFCIEFGMNSFNLSVIRCWWTARIEMIFLLMAMWMSKIWYKIKRTKKESTSCVHCRLLLTVHDVRTAT